MLCGYWPISKYTGKIIFLRSFVNILVIESLNLTEIIFLLGSYGPYGFKCIVCMVPIK
jgi:hypothetical protein